MPLIFDSHLDLAWNALTWKRDLLQDLDSLNAGESGLDDFLGRGRATVSFPELRETGVAVCLGTAMARVPYGGAKVVHGASLDFPAHANACAFGAGQLEYYHCLDRLGETRLIRSSADLRTHWDQWKAADSFGSLPVGIIFAFEGCDAIVHPGELAYWVEKGLRCASLVHYGQSAYACGTGEDGPLSKSGKALLEEMERTGVILDLTHLSDTSFYEALDHFQGPVLASHQNCRHLVPGQRQFSDEQIKRVLERDGVLGVALDSWMLYPGWKRGERIEEVTSYEVVGLEALADHIDHLCQLAGDSLHAAIGTDLDGGFGNEQTPRDLRRLSDLQKLAPILSRRGYSEGAIDGIFHGNWLRFFLQHLPPTSSTH
ncbi:MAG: membrane dipeptidase [Verrucomicrobiota bacterium]